MLRNRSIIPAMISGVLEHIRGPRRVIEVENNGTLQTVITGYVLMGFSINLICTQSKKRCLYDRWWIKNRSLYTYEVRTEFEGEPPLCLKQALSTVAHFPNILIPYVPHAAQRDAAIAAYLDMVIIGMVNADK